MLCGREPEPAWICSFSLAPRPHGAQIWSPCQLLPKPQAAHPDVNTRSEAAHSLSVRQITIYYPTISSRRAQIFGSATVCAAPVAARSKLSRHFGFLTKPYSMRGVLRLVLWTQPRSFGSRCAARSTSGERHVSSGWREFREAPLSNPHSFVVGRGHPPLAR